MSTASYTVIEIYDEHSESWFFVMDTFLIWNVDYNVHALFFGKNNKINIKPNSVNRGFPKNINELSLKILSHQAPSASWITLQEIYNIDLSTTSIRTVTLIIDESSNIERLHYTPLQPSKDAIIIKNEVNYLKWSELNGETYINKKLTAEEIIYSNQDFKLLLNILKNIENKYPANWIRIVTSFDH
jgi:hypothetical protein